MELLAELGKKAGDKDAAKLEQYRKDQHEIKHEAENKQRESESHLRHHTLLACSLTMFQLAIAVAAISVLTKRKGFWFACMGFGLVGLVLLLMTLGMGVFGGLFDNRPAVAYHLRNSPATGAGAPAASRHAIRPHTLFVSSRRS